MTGLVGQWQGSQPLLPDSLPRCESLQDSCLSHHYWGDRPLHQYCWYNHDLHFFFFFLNGLGGKARFRDVFLCMFSLSLVNTLNTLIFKELPGRGGYLGAGGKATTHHLSSLLIFFFLI